MKLVNKIASLMTEAGNKWFHRSAGRLISVKAAKNIQKRAYENSFCSPDESCTPVYREIALQLEDKNEQVFRAAVYKSRPRLSFVVLSESALPTGGCVF